MNRVLGGHRRPQQRKGSEMGEKLILDEHSRKRAALIEQRRRTRARNTDTVEGLL